MGATKPGMRTSVPGSGTASYDELLDYARQTGDTVFHAACTLSDGDGCHGGGR